MENTKKILEEMVVIFNTNKNIQKMINDFQELAEMQDMSEEEWENFKQALFSCVFYKLVLEHEDIKKEIAEDVYKEFMKDFRMENKK